MTPRLSEDLRQAIAEHGGAPLDVVDPGTNVKYVLVRKDVFETMRAVRGDNEPEDLYPLLADISPEDWEDSNNYAVGDS